MAKNKIQALLVKHLMKHGQISLLLPDGVTVEIGLTQEDTDGKLIIDPEYCWVIASHKDRSASLDLYNLGIKFEENEKVLVFEDSFMDKNEKTVRRFDVV